MNINLLKDMKNALLLHKERKAISATVQHKHEDYQDYLDIHAEASFS